MLVMPFPSICPPALTSPAPSSSSPPSSSLHSSPLHSPLLHSPRFDSATRFDYVTVGHVTRDLIARAGRGESVRPGGSAFYSALQAARLGMRSMIVTQGVPAEIEALLAPFRDELELRVIPARETTTLSTRGRGGERSQRLLAWAGPITAPIEVDTAILHLAPVARETPSWTPKGAGFVGMTPQGLVRTWRNALGVALVQLDTGSLLRDAPPAPPTGDPFADEITQVALDPALLPERFDAAVISEQECRDCNALFAAARACGGCVAVTAGARPATVHLPAPAHTPAPAATPTRAPVPSSAPIPSPTPPAPIPSPPSPTPTITPSPTPTTTTPSSAPTTTTPSPTPTTAPTRVVQTPLPPLLGVRDDLGAGDVFAAAFFVALAEGRTPLQAATLGNAAAAVRIAGDGATAIGDRARIEAVAG
jgi:hypothetical protein